MFACVYYGAKFVSKFDCHHMMTIKYFRPQHSMLVLCADSHIQFDCQYSTFNSILGNHFGTQQDSNADNRIIVGLQLLIGYLFISIQRFSYSTLLSYQYSPTRTQVLQFSAPLTSSILDPDPVQSEHHPHQDAHAQMSATANRDNPCTDKAQLIQACWSTWSLDLAQHIVAVESPQLLYCQAYLTVSMAAPMSQQVVVPIPTVTIT